MFYTTLNELQIENTSICNAACPMCLRESTPGDYSWFKEDYLAVSFFYDRIPQEIYDQLKSILFNGVLGDPCAAPNFIEVCQMIKSKNPNIKIRVSTNGGMRNETFWSKLASVTDEVVFAIDGLADTNHIYRVNVNYDKVLNNAKAFIAAGGTAHWQFISFAHNEHQIEDARNIANELGFAHFFIKPSYRFILDDVMGTQRYGAGGVLLAPPKSNVHPLVQIKSKFDVAEWQASSNNSVINCYAIHRKTAYIDYQGHLFPCCPLSAGISARHTIKTFKDGWDELWNNHGQDRINLNNHSWNEIVNGSFFAGVKDSWDKDYANGRLAGCAGACSNSTLKFNDKNGSNKSS